MTFALADYSGERLGDNAVLQQYLRYLRNVILRNRLLERNAGSRHDHRHVDVVCHLSRSQIVFCLSRLTRAAAFK